MILKVDGLNADLLNGLMAQTDPATHRPVLPWLNEIFPKHGVVFENFYTRGISLSTPSWSMLDSGRHSVIRGNVEYDRYTARVYDYLNFFPFYVQYARKRQVDMPGVEVLDRAGIPLMIDSYPYAQEYQSFQLLQRGVRWTTFREVMLKRVKSQLMLAPVESVGPTSLDGLLEQQTEAELLERLKNPEIFYLDFFTGDVDHEGHLTNQVATLTDVLKHVDARAGRLWSAIQKSDLAARTLFVMVSDHGMNNRPDVYSQTFNLPNFFASAAGGGHHIVTNRHQLEDFKIMGLNPMVHRVVTPSMASNYLQGEASSYPTAWLDIDGNERAAVHLRNGDLNKMQMLLEQLARKDLTIAARGAIAGCVSRIIERHRKEWATTAQQLTEELEALKGAIAQRKDEVGEIPRRWTSEQRGKGEDRVALRSKRDVAWWEQETSGYQDYVSSLQARLRFVPNLKKPFRGSMSQLIPPRQLGDNNSVHQLQNYPVGLKGSGVVLTADGKLDEAATFSTIDYFPILLKQSVRNNPQPKLSNRPIDFVVLALPDGTFGNLAPEAQHGYWIYGGDDSQLLVLTDREGRISTRAISQLKARPDGNVTWKPIAFRPGLPLRLFEDPALHLPGDTMPGTWLRAWHSEQEWLEATHRCEYSTAVIGVTELLSPVGENVPGMKGMSETLLRYERRRRELVQADFHVFAASGWNFNSRKFNPGGNHGSFFRISTHSVWMMAGAGMPVKSIPEPHDSLNFASTIMSLTGKAVPMPDRVVKITR